MPYNNLFPVGYQPSIPYFPQYQYQQPMQTQQPAQQQPTQQTMSQPTVHADIIQVESRQFVENWQVAAGTSQMFILRDESAIFVKTAYQNGGYEIKEFAEKQPVQKVDMTNFVTREELEERIKAITGGKEQT